MDQQFNQFIEQSVSQCINSPVFSSLTGDQKAEMIQKITEHFYNLILTTTLDNLTDEQFVQIKDLTPKDPVLEQKIEEFSSEMPFLAQAIEDQIDKDSKYIQQNGQLPPQQA